MTAEEYYKQGRALYEEGEYEGAEAAYKKATELDLRYARPWHGLGNIYFHLQNFDLAIESYSMALTLDPKVTTWVGLGNTYISLKKYNAAIEAYHNARKLDPQYAPIWNGIGIVYYSLKEYNLAIEAYRSGIKSNPQSIACWNGLGVVYADLEEYDAAIEAYLTAIELDPLDAYPWNGLGNVYKDLKDYNAANDAYRSAIEVDPEYSSPWNGLGNMYSILQKYDEALEAYRNAIGFEPQLAHSWNGLGDVYFNIQEGEEAARFYLRAEYLNQEQFAINYFRAFSNTDSHHFFSYRIIQNYMQPMQYQRWVKFIRTTLENATPLKAYITWQCLQVEHGGLPEAKWCLWLGLLNYFMGDPSVALQYLNKSQDLKEELALMLNYYQLECCWDFHEPEEPYMAPALEKAETYLPEQSSGWQFWKKKEELPALNEEETIQCYYAGMIFIHNDELEKALQCFERIERQFLPATYQALWCCEELVKPNLKKEKAAYILEQEKGRQEFTKGIKPVFLDLDETNFVSPFLHVARYFELTEAIEVLHDYVEYGGNPHDCEVESSKSQPYFHQLWKIRPEDWRRINARILEELNYRAFDQLFEEELQPKVKTASKLTEAMIEQRLDQYENTELRSVFERLRTLAAKGKAEQGLGELVKAGQFQPEQYQLFNAYLYSNRQLADYERIMLDFYILLQAEMTGDKLSKAQLAGVKKGADAVITDSLSYAIGFGASLMVPGLPAAVTAVGGVLGGYAIKMGAGALTELFMGFIQEEEPAFESYADFKEQFEGYIGERRRVLGEEGFYKRYPIKKLYGEGGLAEKE